jgi:hypothetical protein
MLVVVRRLDMLCPARRRKRAGFEFPEVVDRPADEVVGIALLRRQIEQHRLDIGVHQVRRDLGTHDPRAEDGDFADFQGGWHCVLTGSSFKAKQPRRSARRGFEQLRQNLCVYWTLRMSTDPS